MANDIQAIDPAKPVNTIDMVLSTTATGFSSVRNVSRSVSPDKQIANIESKFTDRFDEITYYTIGNNSILGG